MNPEIKEMVTIPGVVETGVVETGAVETEVAETGAAVEATTRGHQTLTK
jgi:hypothetical protein